ncbi:uncharacterized protein LOC114731948 isoform X1 [Neltuma alba]|uniref:uncharacterized protein LOC114731948 isoform X1 n=1 Tax=Neltuma alba TaxID=207710 RepID=UPI0010A3A88E|nr:uncharacterized protein LOC114731948 isoform X1 [Prosopis alba]
MADYQHRRHDHYHKFHHHQTGRFMPMLCSRPSMLEDVTVPRWRNRTASLSDDPLSPRIGCMGQVKRNNKVVGLPTTSQSRGFISLNSKCNVSSSTQSRGLISLTSKGNVSSSTPFSALVKYSKLGKIFYAKNLSTNTPDTAHTATSCGGKRRDLARNDRNRGESCVTVSIEEMDPPLPVVKRAQKSEAERGAESLWKRRSGGVALRTLQLQHIHHPRHLLQPTSV